MSFARFMELALFCPVFGYYEKEPDTIGRRGDYYTSVSVGSLFGELLAWRFAEWFEELEGGLSQCQRAGGGCHPKGQFPHARTNRTGRCRIVEAGAHGGQLARDILGWLREHRSRLFARLEYWIVEPSGRRRIWQERTLEEFFPKLNWAPSFADVAQSSTSIQKEWVPSIFFSNELLDSFPVHRLGWDAAQQRWFEWGVNLEESAPDEDRFVWVRLDRSQRCHSGQKPADLLGAFLACLALANATQPRGFEDLRRQFGPLFAVLPDGFTLDICPAASEWWRQAADVLRCGKLLTIDYGCFAEDFLLPRRAKGTLRAYRRHTLSPDPLSDPGEQDLTAHVNFSALRQAGEASGLITEALIIQTEFLTGIAEKIWTGGSAFGPWTPKHTRQFQTLTHPEHLGRAFQVLIQTR